VFVSVYFSLEMETQQQIVITLSESFKCCVCFDIPLPNSTVYSCHPNGHAVCSYCFEHIELEELEANKKCPLCRVGFFVDTKHTLIQSVFDTCSPMFFRPCKYSEFGCHNVEQGDKYFQHENECTMSPAECPTCFYTAPFEKFYNKQLTNHEIVCYNTVETTPDKNKYVWNIRLYLNETKLLTSKGYFSTNSKLKQTFLRCQENPDFKLALVLKGQLSKLHVAPCWMDRERQDPPLITTALRFNGNAETEICVVTPPNFQQPTVRNFNEDFFGITLTRKQLIHVFLKERNACFHCCNPIKDSDYIELQIMCNKKNSVC
jgi:hypothetical protein